ncbi:hypothetical protein NC653_008246 [Populus alba x Populus x berolinensis]|uniref:Pentatricopeptide repeat-containing protein n=1 Tax=Populus alba x Populus x berolinensis TaxID=444605 RepID=A0AAD6R680_9ROSI|nr:hypothetical protein NC653_008246 [Populus alba x Populus x berolinensis]
MLRSALLELKTDFLEAGSSSSVPQFLSDASLTSTRCPSNSGKIDLFIFNSCEYYTGSKPKKHPKRERTEEEKTFRRRAGHFRVTQAVAVLVFLSVMSSNDFSEVEVVNCVLDQHFPKQSDRGSREEIVAKEIALVVKFESTVKNHPLSTHSFSLIYFQSQIFLRISTVHLWLACQLVDHEPYEIVLGSLLGACQRCRNANVGERVIQLFLEMELSNSGKYVILSKIYANMRRWDDSAKTRVWCQNPCCNWIDIGARVHEFHAGDNLNHHSPLNSASGWIISSDIGAKILNDTLALRSIVTSRNIRYQGKKTTNTNPYSLMNSVQEENANLCFQQ